MSLASYKSDELKRISIRLKRTQKPARPQEHTERAHLIQLRQLVRKVTEEELNAAIESTDVCVYCSDFCLAPVLVATFPIAQQMVWDALHQKYTEAVARDFFAQMVASIKYDDEAEWLKRLERISE